MFHVAISDSEKLLVLDRYDANLFTEFTRSKSVPVIHQTSQTSTDEYIFTISVS